MCTDSHRKRKKFFHLSKRRYVILLRESEPRNVFPRLQDQIVFWEEHRLRQRVCDTNDKK